MSDGVKGRALHYVFRVGNRQASYDFYVGQLGMIVLRHEEFQDECKAACNGLYDGAWSKTMMGYGNEDDHFVIEVTYNYGVSSYELGNDYKGIFIESDEVLEKVIKNESAKKIEDNYYVLYDPDGHAFYVRNGSTNTFPITKIALNVKDLKKSTDFWSQLLGMKIEVADSKKNLLSFAENQCKLELVSLPAKTELKRGKAYGRLAFSCPSNQLKQLESKIKKVNKNFIHTHFVSLDTPGKASVEVVILQDPNRHEICFVGDEAYRELSKIDPKSKELMETAIKNEIQNLK